MVDLRALGAQRIGSHDKLVHIKYSAGFLLILSPHMERSCGDLGCPGELSGQRQMAYRRTLSATCE